MDITYCNATKCPHKDECLRFMTKKIRRDMKRICSNVSVTDAPEDKKDCKLFYKKESEEQK